MIVLDTTILLYAVGQDEHPLADPSRKLIHTIGTGALPATTTVEAIQEFAHVRSRRRSRREAVDHARSYASLLAPLLEVGRDDLLRGLRLYERHHRLGAFDAVLAAAALRLDADALVSADRAFADVRGLNAVTPGSPAFDELLAS